MVAFLSRSLKLAEFWCMVSLNGPALKKKYAKRNTYVKMCVCVCVYVSRVCVCVSVYVYVCVCECVCVYVSVYVCSCYAAAK